MRIMIVDDNKLFRNVVRNIVDWKQLNHTIVADAINGKHAIQLLQNTEIDLIITDISMPEMNGIELIRYIKDEMPQIKVIVLSNYDDFEFVKDALKLGALDYLLKYDFNADITMEVIEKCDDEIRKDKKKYSVENQRLQQQYLEIDYFIQQWMLQSVEDTWVTTEFERIFNKNTLSKSVYLNMQVDHCERTTHLLRDWLLKSEAVNSLIFVASIKKNRLLLMLNVHHVCKESQMYSFAVEKAHAIECYSREMGFHISIAVSNIFYGIQEAKSAFIKSEDVLDRMMYDKNRHIEICNDNVNVVKGDFDYKSFIKKFMNQTKNTHEFEEIKMDIDIIFKTMKDMKLDSVNLGKVMYELSTVVAKIAYHNDVDLSTIIGNEMNLYAMLSECIFVEDKKDFLIQVITDIQKRVGILSEVNNQDIRKIIQHIHDQYMLDLTLATIAEEFNYSPNYLSGLFKSEKGINLTDYIKEVRIEKAKEYMIENCLKTYEVAEKTGFKSVSYFCTVFKEVTGMTPKEFKTGRCPE